MRSATIHTKKYFWLDIFLLILMLIPTSAFSATQGTKVAPQETVKSLLRMPGFQNGSIVLTRTYELSVFSSSTGNQDAVSDSYRIVPLHLAARARVRVDLLDGNHQTRAVVIPEEDIDAGNHFFVLTYEAAASRLAGGAAFILHVEASAIEPAPGIAQRQTMHADGFLQEKTSGGVLGITTINDVLIDRGQLLLSREDLNLKGRGPSFGFARSYSSQSGDRRLYSTMGPGWSHTYEKALEIIACGETVQPFNLPGWVVQSAGRIAPWSALPETTERPRYVKVNGTHFKRVKNRWVPSCTRHGSLIEKETTISFVALDGTLWVYQKPPELPLQPPDDLSGPFALLPDLRYGPPPAWPLAYVQDRNGNRLTLEYADSPIGPVVKQVTDAVGRALTFEYQPGLSHPPADESQYLDRPLRLAGVSGVDGLRLDFAYHPQTFLLASCRRDVRVETYDYAPSTFRGQDGVSPFSQSFQLIQIKDANGHETRYDYCGLEDLPASVHRIAVALKSEQAVKKITFADLTAMEIQYDPTMPNERVIIDPRGHATRFHLNEYGNTVKQVEPLGRTTAWTWALNRDGSDIVLLNRTDHLGNQVFYTYDHKGNVIRERDGDDNLVENEWLLPFGLLLAESRNGTKILQNRYDARGNLISRIDADGRQTSLTYNSFGECVREVGPDGHVTDFLYDRWGNLQCAQSSDRGTIHYQHDMRGRLVKRSEQGNRHWITVFDNLDRPVETQEPGKAAVRRVYDAKGNVVKEIRAGRAQKSFVYDSRDRLILSREGNRVREFTYDANSNLLSVSRDGVLEERHRYNELDEEIVARYAAQGLTLSYHAALEDSLSGVSLPENLHNAGPEQRRRALKAEFFNRRGVFFYNRDQFDISLKYFTRAVELSNHSISFLRNCMHAFNEQERYAEALAFLEKNQQPFRQDESLRSWHAWLLAHTEREKDAAAVYEALFSQGYRNEEDFQLYAQLLTKLGRYGILDRAFAQYLKGGRSELILMEQAKILRTRKKYTKALALLDQLQKGNAFNLDIAYEKIHNYFGLKQYRKARGICVQLIDNGYESADAYYFKGDAEYLMKQLPEARQSMETALQLAPDDDEIKDYLDHIAAAMGQGENRTIKAVIPPVPIPSELAGLMAEKVAAPDAEESDAFYHYRIKCYNFRKGEPLAETTYNKIKVLNTAGVANLNTLKIDFDPLYEELHVNRLAVLNAQGQLVAEGNPEDYYIMDARPDDLATYDKILYMPVPRLAPGAVIEWTVTRRTKGICSSLPFQRETLFSSRPVHLAALYVGGDSASILHSSTNTAAPRRVDHGWLWVERNQGAYHSEPEAAPEEAFKPVVGLAGAGRTWEQEGRVYASKLKEVLILDDQMRRLAASLVGPDAAPQDAIEKLSRYVQSELTYQGIEFGSRGTIPNSAGTILHRKYGDCKDHAVLLRQLLTAAGLRACLALVNTDALVDPALPSVDQFNHMIVCVTLADNLRFVDPTDKGSRLGVGVPDGLAGRRVLLLDPEAIRLADIPAYPADQCRISSRRSLAMEKQEDLLVSERVVFQGYPAAHMRSYLNRMKSVRRPAWVQEVLTSFYPSARLKSIDFLNLQDTSRDLVFEMEYAIDGACEQTEQTRAFRVPNPWEQYYLKTRAVWRRTTPFEIAYPLRFESVVTLPRLSDFKTVEAVPAAERNPDNPFCRWKVGLASPVSDSFQMKFDFSYLTGVFRADEYRAYQSVSDQALTAANCRFVYHR